MTVTPLRPISLRLPRITLVCGGALAPHIHDTWLEVPCLAWDAMAPLRVVEAALDVIDKNDLLIALRDEFGQDILGRQVVKDLQDQYGSDVMSILVDNLIIRDVQVFRDAWPNEQIVVVHLGSLREGIPGVHNIWLPQMEPEKQIQFLASELMILNHPQIEARDGKA